MELTPRLQKWILAGLLAILAAVYSVAWLAPAIGLENEDGILLVAARALAAGHGYSVDSLPIPVPLTGHPPLLPILLALFSLGSGSALWLKLVPLCCAGAWLWLTRKLLLKMGASPFAAWMITGLTAAAPVTVFVSTNLLPETLFALLLTAALLLLLKERPISAGVCGGLAFLTHVAGMAVIAACAVVLLMRRRLRAAIQFTAAAMALVLPWAGWSAARGVVTGGSARIATNVLTGLQPSEKLVVMGHNLMALLASPLALLTNYKNVWTATGTLVIAAWCLYRRRRVMPDLLLLLYFAALDLLVWSPQRMVVPVLPLVLWFFWRAARTIEKRERIAAVIVILGAATIGATLRQIPHALRDGQFPSSPEPVNDWRQMQKMFTWVREHAPSNAVVMANLDSAWYLNTGRKAVRGFAPNPFRSVYLAGGAAVTAPELAANLLRSGAAYVAVSPDCNLPEGAAYTKAVQALERGGLVEPIDGLGLAHGYRLLRATGVSILR